VLADHIPRELTLDAMCQGAAATALVSGKAPDRPGFYYEPARRHPARMPETRTLYDEATAWSHRQHLLQSDVAA
jgi:hypothetical protein